jgi:alpha-amylase
MGRIRLIAGTHNHIPLGLAQDAAERRYQEAFKPLLSVLYRYPDFPVTLHYSGILMEWLEESHPEFLTLLGEMVKRGQVEVLGGGYYDPILPLIPTNDKLGQLEKMTTWLRVKFETRPRGCWIAENVWEPSLTSILRASGLDYTFVEDGQFRIAGASGGAMWHPAIAEDQGKIITVFPLASGLAALAGSAPPAHGIAWLRELASGVGEESGSAVAVLLEDGADGNLVKDGWFEQFLGLVAENADWLEMATPGQYLREHPPDQRLYLPASSSSQITLWALPPQRRAAFTAALEASGGVEGARQFISGGHFRHFLTRYPEAWLLYAKMMNTHVLVNQVRGDRYKKKAAQNELWKGQSHHAYWHAAAGGIYDNPLRKAVYKSLIEAEKITRATEIFAPSILSIDFDMDNCIEYLYQGSELNAYIHTRGGALFELDFLPASWNYLDTMVDREQLNGSAGSAPDALDGSAAGTRGSAPLVEGYPRRAFIDHFLTGGSVRDLAAAALGEAGDFAAGPYELIELNRALPELLLRRSGRVLAAAGPRPATIEKRFVFRPRSIDVYYRVVNTGPQDLTARFGVEINLSLAARSPDSGRLFLLEEDRKKEIDSDTAEIEGVQSLLVRDVRNEVSVTVSSARPFHLWSAPMETRCGGRAVFQAHCFLPLWELSLGAGESWENHMSVGFEKSQASGQVF